MKAGFWYSTMNLSKLQIKEKIKTMGYQLKITIKNSHPPIWRRILVPNRITFFDLDDIIEKAFGWTHDPLDEFAEEEFMDFLLESLDGNHPEYQEKLEQMMQEMSDEEDAISLFVLYSERPGGIPGIWDV